MMRFRRTLTASFFVSMIISTNTQALEAEIQGKRFVPKRSGESCVEISGAYPSMRIESSEAGKVPQICFDSSKDNIITIHNVTFVATDSAKEEIAINFGHTFPPGPNGLIMGRTKLKGFFSTATGTGVATGDKIKFTGFFSQGDKTDAITQPFEHAVGDELESALFQYEGKKQYLIAGERTLKARLLFTFSKEGHKLTLPSGTTVSVDTGSRFEDKLETFPAEPPEESLPEEPAF